MDNDLADLHSLGSGSDALRRSAIKALYERNARRYLGFLKNRGMSNLDAEDVLSELFSKLWSSRVDWTEIENASAYLWRMLRSTATDFQRRQSRKHDLVADQDDDEFASTLDESALKAANEGLTDSEQHDLRGCLERSIAAFDRDHPDRSQTISLVILEGWSKRELADHLGRSYGATREYFSQCCKKFREYFRKICPEYEGLIEG